MKNSGWKAFEGIKNPNVCGMLEIKGSEAVLSSECEGGYRIVACECLFEGFEGDCLYDFSMKVEKNNLNFAINYFWYDENKKELCAGYLNPADELKCPVDKAYLKIVIRAFGKKAGSVTASLPEISFKGKYSKRKAVIAAVPISYGFVHQHKIRTFEDNLKDSLDAIDGLMGDYKADLVVLTECFYSRCINGRSYEESLLSVNSSQIEAMKNKAKEHGIYISFSFKEIAENGEIYNSALLIDRKGEIKVNYHKIHLTCGELYDGMTPGDKYEVYECDFGKVGFAICWDLFFPEHTAILRQMGAEIIINPSAGFDEARSRTRASENGVYLINGGTHPHTTMIFDPSGEKIASCAYGTAVAEIDLEEPKYIKYLSVGSSGEGRNVYFHERRPDTYGILTMGKDFKK